MYPWHLEVNGVISIIGVAREESTGGNSRYFHLKCLNKRSAAVGDVFVDFFLNRKVKSKDAAMERFISFM